MIMRSWKDAWNSAKRNIFVIFYGLSHFLSITNIFTHVSIGIFCTTIESFAYVREKKGPSFDTGLSPQKSFDPELSFMALRSDKAVMFRIGHRSQIIKLLKNPHFLTQPQPLTSATFKIANWYIAFIMTLKKCRIIWLCCLLLNLTASANRGDETMGWSNIWMSIHKHFHNKLI